VRKTALEAAEFAVVSYRITSRATIRGIEPGRNKGAGVDMHQLVVARPLAPTILNSPAVPIREIALGPS